ncbi:hypothetical protein GCM10010433_13120 [Streptomyces pulveraceus]
MGSDAADCWGTGNAWELGSELSGVTCEDVCWDAWCCAARFWPGARETSSGICDLLSGVYGG